MSLPLFTSKPTVALNTAVTIADMTGVSEKQIDTAVLCELTGPFANLGALFTGKEKTPKIVTCQNIPDVTNQSYQIRGGVLDPGEQGIG